MLQVFCVKLYRVLMLKTSCSKSKAYADGVLHRFMNPAKSSDTKLRMKDALKFFDTTLPVSAYKSLYALT